MSSKAILLLVVTPMLVSVFLNLIDVQKKNLYLILCLMKELQQNRCLNNRFYLQLIMYWADITQLFLHTEWLELGKHIRFLEIYRIQVSLLQMVLHWWHWMLYRLRHPIQRIKSYLNSVILKSTTKTSEILWWKTARISWL